MQRKYSRPKLVAYIVEKLDSGKSTSELASAVAAYLISVGKSGDLQSVMRDAQERRARQHGIVELTARSAHTLDAAQRSQIEAIAKQQYQGAKSVTVHEQLDESVIAGATVSLPQASLDISVRNKLNQLREAIS